MFLNQAGLLFQFWGDIILKTLVYFQLSAFAAGSLGDQV